MGRRKKHKHRHAFAGYRHSAANATHGMERVYSNREQELIDLAEMADISWPWVFAKWPRFYANEERFLAAAEHWLNLKLQGVNSTIETDLDRGRVTPHRDAYAPQRDEVVVAHAPGWEYQNYDPWANYRQSPYFPGNKAPVIAEPVGVSGVEHVAI